jgi:hypothetical protein
MINSLNRENLTCLRVSATRTQWSPLVENLTTRINLLMEVRKSRKKRREMMKK